jgi:hypothetical protein
MLQEQLWLAFAYPIQWWLILFLVAGVFASAFAFAFVMLGKWMEKS